MLLCAVVDDASESPRVRREHTCDVPAISSHVKHAGDQVVVFSEARVVPLFQVIADRLVDDDPQLDPSDFLTLSKGKVMHIPSGSTAFVPPSPSTEIDRCDVKTKRVFEQRARQCRRNRARQQKLVVIGERCC